MSSESDYQVNLCTSGAQLRGAYDVRLTVFVKEQGYALSDEIDQYDPLAAHFILTSNADPSTVLGTLRLLPYPLPIPKPDAEGSEPEPCSSYPLGGSRSESAIAGDFVSAAWSAHPPVKGRRDPAETKEEERRTEEEVPELGGAKLGRLALMKEVRGKGLGHLLVREAERWLLRVLGSGEAVKKGAFGPRPSKQGVAAKGGQEEEGERGEGEGDEEGKKLDSIIIKLSSQVYAIGFYKKLGYTPVGEQYDEDGAPHQLCYKQVFLEKLA
ncbi:uncharacterized protein UBRO_00260 [Ustilago bromivora]|uniref:Uncharacterized protein n=1 Tax=Ustilago bromivora TaxID=307758 RepID=A0A1K0GYC3_9BASI|nr:uncharacterized protein UBRO_00260 [Ustilago bromivora]SYW76679.1 uncharacterized protein UBRO2_01516 [Ustilago bromivora]